MNAPAGPQLACMCTLPHYFVNESNACTSACDCDGERVCRAGVCAGAARPKLYAPLAHTSAVDATLAQAPPQHTDFFGSRLAPLNDGCTVALYNYHNAHRLRSDACAPAESCTDVGMACSALFHQDTDIERCVRANSFSATPGGVLDQTRSLTELNHACCGDVADPACDGAIARHACRWDAALRRAVRAREDDSTTAAGAGAAACCATQAQQVLRDAAALRDGFGSSHFFGENRYLFHV